MKVIRKTVKSHKIQIPHETGFSQKPLKFLGSELPQLAITCGREKDATVE